MNACQLYGKQLTYALNLVGLFPHPMGQAIASSGKSTIDAAHAMWTSIFSVDDESEVVRALQRLVTEKLGNEVEIPEELK